MPAASPPVSVFRLRFIDLARALAILLMLEGHFVDVTLSPQWRVGGHPAYDAWLYVRGLAAPMFFTVTGLIFSYLLCGAREGSFWRIKRVRRGLLRAAELLLWGYLLQINVRFLPAALAKGEWNSWIQAFHVLQCIGVGLVALIAIFGLARRLGPSALTAAYLVAGLIDFLMAVLLANQAGPIPLGAPSWLQNPLKGPWSNFPVAPWLAFTFYGAAIGVLVRHRVPPGGSLRAALAFLTTGLTLKTAGWALDRWLGARLLDLTQLPAPRILPDVFHGRIGEILIVLGILIYFEKKYRPAGSWLQTVGRNTFPIYVGHVILLYGGISGFGIENLLRHALKPWQAALGALMFCGFFVLMAQWVEPLVLRWRGWRAHRHH